MYVYIYTYNCDTIYYIILYYIYMYIYPPINQSSRTCQADRSDCIPSNMVYALFITFVVLGIGMYTVYACIQLASRDS